MISPALLFHIPLYHEINYFQYYRQLYKYVFTVFPDDSFLLLLFICASMRIIKQITRRTFCVKRLLTETKAENLWSVLGDFAVLTGNVQTDATRNLMAQTEEYRLSMTRKRDESGIICQKSTFTNLSGRTLTIRQLLSKFVLDGGEYDVYTQLNGWQKESLGTWQPLMSTVMVESPKMRFCDGAAPMLAVRNRQTGRGLAFHLPAEGAWQMSAVKQFLPGETCNIIIEVGLCNRNLALTAAPGESIAFPEVLFYEFRNAADLDCYKLHDYCNRRFPTWRMPVIYNTWLYQFDRINYENVMQQIEPAARIGAEYFVIDAGWFGNEKATNWGEARGDWSESLTYGFCGRMKEIAEAVRAHGMKFGLWLEPEIASPSSDAIREHREWFLQEGEHYFLNFTDPAAVAYIYETTCGLIERYDIAFIKFDFNASMYTDPLCQDFLAYFKGYNHYLQQLRERYPGLYLSCCASGGLQTNLSICRNYDSIWISDNQSIYDSMRIFKDSLLRMPPQMLEKWSVITSLSGATPDRYAPADKILSTDDATWSRAIEVHESLLRGFMQGSPIGLSYDLTGLSPADFQTVQETIRRFKEERSFWQTAVCRILADTESMLVLQYSDRELNRIQILIYTKRICQQLLTVYPIVQREATYRLLAEDSAIMAANAGDCFTGRALDADGIDVTLNGNYRYTAFTLEKLP